MMVTLTLEIEEGLMARLRAKAQAEDKAVESIIIDMLRRDAVNEVTLDDPTNMALSLAQVAESLNLRSGRSDVSEQFDAVLNELDDSIR